LGRIEKSIEIKASPAKVWMMLALDRLPEWNEEYGDVKYTSEVRNPEDKYSIGARSHTKMKGAGEIDFEITESLENEKISYRVQGMKGVRNANGTFTLKPTEVGTKITAVSDVELSSFMLKMLSRVVSRALEKDFEKGLGKLKSILEK